MDGSRRLSQAISEGDGISVIAYVADAAAARAAETQGAEGLALLGPVAGVREATGLPILFRAGSPQDAREASADAWLLVVEELDSEAERLAELYAQALELGLECVVDVRDDEELALALEHLDPEIFLLSAREADEDEAPLERVLELLLDVPAGKLAIAELAGATREEVANLERRGVDAVLVATGNVADLVGATPPSV